jgi:hypothetical protein
MQSSDLSCQDTLHAGDSSWSQVPGQLTPIPPRNEPLQFSGLSRQDTLPAEDSSWSYSQVSGQPTPIPPCNEPLQSSGLCRQDTLPAEDSSWSYSHVPGKPAPIPPRNEPLLYISNIVDDLDLHTTALYLNLNLRRIRVHFPPSLLMATTSESILYDKGPVGITQADICLETLTDPDHDSGKDVMTSQVCRVDSGLLSSFRANPVPNLRTHFAQTRLFVWMT